jgi:RHS repeat-associated protein
VLAAMEDGTDGTVLSRHYSVYETNRELHFPYWDTSTNKPFLPIRAVAFDDGGNTVDTYEVDPDCTTASGGVPAGISATQDDYVRWTRYIYGEVVGNLAAEHAYHNIPSSGYGTKDTNYAETLAGYDAIRRQDRIVQPGGTIHRRVFDARSRVASVWVGTDDTPSSGEWSPTNNSGANMTKISEYEYDGGAVGGNSNLTKEIEYLTDDVEANAQVTKHRYDWRDRLVFSVDPEEYDGKATYSRQELDNLDRVTKDEKYYDADDDADFPDDGSADAGDRLLGRNEILWDNLSRVYLAKTYAVNPSNGAIGSALHSDVWYDASGHVIKGAKGNQLTKSVYDGLGRTTVRYISHDTDESAYADADDVSGDTVIEQSETAYDGSGNVIAMTHYARKHTAGSTGMLSSSDARVSYLAFWYDAASRRTAVANYGTNGGSAFSRPSTAPSSSDTVLVTTSEYDSAGRAYKTTDPAGREDRLEFDDMGRLTKTIQNYTDGNPATGGSDEDVTIERGYNADGALLTLTANNPTTGDQVTRYVYGTYVGVLNPFAYRNDVLRAEIYPDSDDTVALGNGNDGTYDRIEYLCNRRGNAIQIKHQTGTTHEYVVDKSGRLTHDRITTVGSGVDNAVLRISTTYDIRGLREKLTSYDNATVGSGSVVNEVVFEYDDMGMLVQEYQEHDGAKDANTLYIQYNRDTTVSNGVYTKRLRYTSVRYPDSRLIHSTYGTSGQTDDALNRTAAINADNSGTPGTALAEYTYLGHAQFVKADYPEPDLRFDLDHGTACDYDGIDRFGRVIDLLWRDYGGSADAVRIRHGYDRASNRLWREDSVAAANSAALDELYDYDEVYRLSNLDRGDLNANKDGLSTGTLGFAQQWGLDMTGNWSGFKEDNNGDMTWDLDQSRTYSAANEIAAIDSSSAHVGQDRAGNMTKIPKPGDSNSHYDLTFDAWHRLVKVCDGTNTVAEYEYDAREFQVSKRTYSDGSLNESRHFYYDDMWHCLEERLETGGTISTNADRQFVWGARYYDDLILRDRDTSEPENGTLDERLYFLQDANWNVVGLTDTNGDVQERYIYTAHGAPVILTPAFAGRASTSYDVETLFAGYRYDSVTKTYLVRHRIYHPILGCWVQRDSLRYIDGLNLYQYVGGNPIVGTDPSGQMSPYCVATLYCAISVLAVCNGAMCIGDYWDDPCDTYLDCSFKCWWSIISGKTANSWNGIAWDVICGGAATVCTAQWAKHLWNKWFPPPRQFPSRPMPPRPPGGNGGGGGGGPRPIRPRPPASPAVPTYPQAV